MSTETEWNRRGFFSRLAEYPAAVSGVGQVPAEDRSKARGLGLVAPNLFLLSPHKTSADYTFDPELVHSDITGGRAGIPLDVVFQIISADGVPIEGARVDFWHDAPHDFPPNQAKETYLRGTQVTDPEGCVRFVTLYPETPPPHSGQIKVWLDKMTVLQGTVLLPSQSAHQSDKPGGYAALRAQDKGYLAELVIGVKSPPEPAGAKPEKTRVKDHAFSLSALFRREASHP